MPPVAYPAVRVVSPAATAGAGEEDLLVNVEREHIQRALLRGARQQERPRRAMLGLSRRALYRRLERLDLGDTISRRRDPMLEP